MLFFPFTLEAEPGNLPCALLSRLFCESCTADAYAFRAREDDLLLFCARRDDIAFFQVSFLILFFMRFFRRGSFY